MNLYQHLSRVMTKGRDFVPQIDGLRFVAITAVLAYHIRAIIARHYGVNGSPAGTDGLVNWTFGAGCKGVELFFAISGFILGVPFARQYLGQAEPVISATGLARAHAAASRRQFILRQRLRLSRLSATEHRAVVAGD